MSESCLGPTPIDGYLDELMIALAGEPPRRLRSLLAEAEAHLRDSADGLVATGLPVDEAERQAVERFGSAKALAAAERRSRQLPVSTVLGQVGLSALLLGGIGALAVGLSGLIAGAIRLVGGTGAIVDVSSGPALTAANCARWVSQTFPARSCRDAALGDWADETVFYRIGMGILGLMALVVYHYLRRAARSRQIGLLPATVRDTIAVCLFGVAGMWTLGLGIDAAVLGGASGQWFSAAVVALAAAAAFGLRLVRDLQIQPDQSMGSVANARD